MRTDGLQVAIHLAESEAEWEMYQNARGPLYDWLKTQRPMDDCGGRSPIQQAHRLGLLQMGLLAIHCNYLAPGDAQLLAENEVVVVHCPRSHTYFKHAPFPFEILQDAGVKIALGTDSLASTLLENGRLPTLNMWDEMRQFAKTHPTAPPERIVQMAAGRFDEAANLIALPYTGPIAEMAATLIHGIEAHGTRGWPITRPWLHAP